MMKKLSLIDALVEKMTSRNERNSRAKRARALRLENLESRELLSVAPGGDFLAFDALAAYESSVAAPADDVLDISGATLDGAPILGATNSPVPLETPTLTVAGVTKTTITVSWDAVPNADRYSFSYKLASDTTWTNKNVGTNTSYTVAGLDLNFDYDVRLKAIGDGVNYKSVYSSIVHVPQSTDPIPLDAPTVSTVEIASDAIFVSWEADSDATGYVISYKESWADDFTEVEVSASESSLILEDLDSDTVYCIEVQALGDDVSWADSSHSATQTAKTKDSSFISLYEYEDLRDSYDELLLPESLTDVNIIIPEDWTAGAILDAVQEAQSTPLSDVILLDSDQYYGDVLDLSSVTITLDVDFETSGSISFLARGWEHAQIKVNDSDVTFDALAGLTQFGGIDFVDVDPDFSVYRLTSTITEEGFETAAVGLQDVDMYDSNGVSVGGASHNAAPSAPTVSATPRADDYALLFIGGGNRFLNKERYYLTLADYYCELVEEFSFDPANIYILYADGDMSGTSSNLFTGNDYYRNIESYYTNSDMSFLASGTTVCKANGVNLTSTLGEIANRMTDNSHLLAWFWDHGSGNSTSRNKETILGEEFISGWFDDIYGTTVRDSLFQIDQGYVTCVFSQCYAGGILDDIFDPATGNLRSVANGYADGYTGSATFAGAAASNHYEPSWSGLENGAYTGYAQTFKDALRQCTTGVAAFEYTENREPFSAIRKPETYVANGGYAAPASEHIEHPWHAGETFPIFSQPVDEQSAPTIDSHAETTMNSISLTWSEVQDATSYTLEYVAAGSSAVETVENISTTSYTVSGLNPATNYAFRVKADNSPYSERAYVWTKAPIPDSPSPLAPPVLTVAGATGSTITVSWTADPNVERYSLSYKPANSTTWKNVNVGTETSYTIAGLELSSDYHVRLKAIGDDIYYKSVYSAIISAQTSSIPDEPDGPVPLATPILTVANATGSTITISWDAIPNAERYSLSYKLAGATTWTNKNVGTETSYTITGLELSSDYEVRLKAIGDGDNYKSVYSAIISAQTDSTPDPVGPVPLATPVLTVEGATGSTITVSWGAIPNADRYSLSYKLASATTWTNKNVGTNVSCMITGLEVNSEYEIRLKAVGDGISYKSVYSAIISAQTNSTPDVPDGPVPLATPVLTVGDATGTTITVSWDAVPNAVRYSLSYKLASATTWTNKNVGTATSYTITGLTPDTWYDVRLKAIGDDVSYKSVYSATVGAQTVAAASSVLDLGDELFDELDDDEYDLLAVNFIA